MSEPTASERVADAYLDAIVCIAEVIGVTMPEAEYQRAPGVDLDQLPATVIVAGQNAIKFLATAAGILDMEIPADSSTRIAEDVCAIWTENAAKAGES
jgi:hypothetical protein